MKRKPNPQNIMSNLLKEINKTKTAQFN